MRCAPPDQPWEGRCKSVLILFFFRGQQGAELASAVTMGILDPRRSPLDFPGRTLDLWRRADVGNLDGRLRGEAWPPVEGWTPRFRRISLGLRGPEVPILLGVGVAYRLILPVANRAWARTSEGISPTHTHTSTTTTTTSLFLLLLLLLLLDQHLGCEKNLGATKIHDMYM